MTTKEKILDTARKLFNTKGLTATSVRDLCAEIGISTGNFTYHYPSKDLIIVSLYKNMVEEIKDELKNLAEKKISITIYLESHRRLFLIQTKYKFIYLNLFEIVTNYTDIKTLYKKNSEFERQVASQMFNVYVNAKVIKKTVTKIEFERVLNVGQIINNSWLIDAEILYSASKKKQLKYYMQICCGLLESYLTDESHKDYFNYFKKIR